MFQIDKTAFGKFLADQRKAKGYTQKMLAEKLFVSDKAVSKWERALSMPDISLLIPLAEILDVSVTELLEGQKLDHTSEMDTGHVEILVKKALAFSEDNLEKKKDRMKKNMPIFAGCTAVTLIELLIGIYFLYRNRLDVSSYCMSLSIFEALSFIFGIYLCFFIIERLPIYYDEYQIHIFHDSFFTLKLPGVNLNNNNWPYIIKSLQVWSLSTMVILPFPCMLPFVLFHNTQTAFVFLIAVLIVYLTGLVVPLYAVGKKYER